MISDYNPRSSLATKRTGQPTFEYTYTHARDKLSATTTRDNSHPDEIDPGLVLKLLALSALALENYKASFVFALWAWTAPTISPARARRYRQSTFPHRQDASASAISSTSDAREHLSVAPHDSLLLREFTATGEPILASPRQVEFVGGEDWVPQVPPSAMDHGACNVIYLDRRAQAKTLRRDSVFPENRSNASGLPSPQGNGNSYFEPTSKLPAELQNNVQSILCTFNEGMLCYDMSCALCLLSA